MKKRRQQNENLESYWNVVIAACSLRREAQNLQVIASVVMLFEQMRGEAIRVSVSSQVSSSSQGSGQDDYDALGYVFMWGEGIGDGFLGGGTHTTDSGVGANLDAYFPKAVGSNVVLDAQKISCGGKHAALVTKQGEVFSWGEDSGGWLGHGVIMNVSYPKLVEALASYTVEFIACGEYHSCALTQSGDLYTWGDGAHNFGLLGHGRDISHWIPKRINGSIEGVRVSSVSCGPWHTAIVTASGQLYTFGDGTFGVLGHGDRMSLYTPKEVEALKGLKTIRATCGVWHTAAIVEVMVGYLSSNGFSSGKLFTWGDGDKGRLGHPDKEHRLVPTCVSSLIDYNFRQVACGHSLTVGLTSSGHVFTFGSTVYGQLGEPRANGKTPVRVEGKLWDSVVEEIACGAHHVAVLTSKSEVYTWGKGKNGRLGHGDVEDKKSPMLVEALKDRQVKSIACGSSFTAAICLHKWGAGSEQPLCASCRQDFSFTKKRHKCYNCGIVVCHTCSSRKCYKALMAPNPNKAYRVCDSCYGKLSQMANHMNLTNKSAFYERPKPDKKMVVFQPQSQHTSHVKIHAKSRKKPDSSLSRVAPTPTDLSGKRGAVLLASDDLHSRRDSLRRGSRSVSPFSRKTSPPRSTTPTPTLRGLASPKVIVEDLKKTNEALSKDILRLQMQIENMGRQHRLQEHELQKKLNDALSSVTEESDRARAAKEVIKSLTAQLKAFVNILPEDQGTDSISEAQHQLFNGVQLASAQGNLNLLKSSRISIADFDREDSQADVVHASENHVSGGHNNGAQTVVGITANRGTAEDSKHEQDGVIENSRGNRVSEWVEQDESGVYITLVSLPNGGRDLKRVRFSRRRFTEKQAELWWAENRGRIFEKYDVKSMDKTVFEPKTGKN